MPIKTPQRSDHADAFIRESDHGAEMHDDLAQHLAEEYLRSAATGDEPEELSREELLAEELGGPFIESRAEQEFGTTMTRARSIQNMRPARCHKRSARSLSRVLTKSWRPSRPERSRGKRISRSLTSMMSLNRSSPPTFIDWIARLPTPGGLAARANFREPDIRAHARASRCAPTSKAAGRLYEKHRRKLSWSLAHACGTKERAGIEDDSLLDGRPQKVGLRDGGVGVDPDREAPHGLIERPGWDMASNRPRQDHRPTLVEPTEAEQASIEIDAGLGRAAHQVVLHDRLGETAGLQVDPLLQLQGTLPKTMGHHQPAHPQTRAEDLREGAHVEDPLPACAARAPGPGPPKLRSP